MPNIATVLNAEISRLARKEIRGATEELKRTISNQRGELLLLKRRVQELERSVSALSKDGARRSRQESLSSTEATAPTPLRFRAAGMANNRKRLGLSAADFGLLVGTTGQTIYAWESGTAKPRANHLAAIATLRGIGKREAAERLSALK